MAAKLALVLLMAVFLFGVQANSVASRHPRNADEDDGDVVAFGDMDPTKVLTQMYDTVKKTIDGVMTPGNIGAAVDKIKAMGDSVVKMGMDLASSMSKKSGP